MSRKWHAAARSGHGLGCGLPHVRSLVSLLQGRGLVSLTALGGGGWNTPKARQGTARPLGDRSVPEASLRCLCRTLKIPGRSGFRHSSRVFRSCVFPRPVVSRGGRFTAGASVSVSGGSHPGGERRTWNINHEGLAPRAVGSGRAREEQISRRRSRSPGSKAGEDVAASRSMAETRDGNEAPRESPSRRAGGVRGAA